jgi:hypothetical protein
MIKKYQHENGKGCLGKSLQLIALCVLGSLIACNVKADEVKPFVSASYIRAADSDVYKWDKSGDGYVIQNTENFATLKAGIVYRADNGFSVDVNLFHESDPTNGRLGHLKEGDKGVNGFEITARKEF